MRAEQVIRDYLLDLVREDAWGEAMVNERVAASGLGRGDGLLLEVPAESDMPEGRYLVTVAFQGPLL